MSATYPATNNDEAVALNIQNANQFHTVVNGDNTEDIATFEGNGSIPSVAKALFEAAAYRVPIDWAASTTETELMQPRLYNGNIYVPKQVPAPMASIPDDTNWRLYSAFNYAKPSINKESQTGADIVGSVSTIQTFEYEVGSNTLLVIVDGAIASNYSETTNTTITWDTGTVPDSSQEIVFIAGDYIPVDVLYDQITTARNEALAAARSTIVTDATTAYSITSSAENSYRRFTSGSAITLTVEPNSTEAVDIGAAFHFTQAGAGQITVAAGAGVTINSAATLLSRAQFSSFTLIKIGTDEWDIFGDLEA